MDLDATPFRAFLQVARHGSFTRAAEEMHISQPALSATIRELERRLGFSLFDRTSRKVELTWEGRAFLVNAKRVVTEHDWTLQRAREILSNDLRLAVQSFSVLIDARVRLTDGFASANPGIDIQIRQYGADRCYDVIRAHDADVALVLEPTHRGELSPLNRTAGSELESLTVTTRPLGLYVPPGHPLEGEAAIHSTMLRGVRVAKLGRVHGASLASAIGRYLDDIGADQLRTSEGDAFSAFRHARAQGIAAVDLGWFDPLLNDPAFAQGRRPIVGDVLETELVAVRQRREQRPAADRFWHFAAAGAAEAGQALRIVSPPSTTSVAPVT